MIAIIDDTARARAKGMRCDGEDMTIEDVRARLTRECEDAATWAMTSAGRVELEHLLRV